MAGKRYSEAEIAKIVVLKNEGKTFEEVAAGIKTEFKVDRKIASLKIIYDRHKGGAPAAEEKPAKIKKVKKVVVEEAAA